MTQAQRVAVLVGSLRAASFSKKVAQALIERAPQALECRVIEIGNLPLYNEDLEADPPPAWTEFRAELRRSDAVLFVTPEYNRSIPGCLKNALDVGSRPEKQSVFDGQPAAVVSVTPYKLGAFGANHALRQTFVFLNMPVLQQPEAYVGKVADVLDDSGKVKDPEAAQLFEKFMRAFSDWIAHARGGAAHDFQAFLKQRREVASAYVRGDAAPLLQIATGVEPATFFSPKGDTLQGADALRERYARDAKTLGKDGNTTELEILQSAGSGNLAFYCGLQHAQVGSGEKSKMTLRVTEVFRFEDGGFKLVHRHADAFEP